MPCCWKNFVFCLGQMDQFSGFPYLYLIFYDLESWALIFFQSAVFPSTLNYYLFLAHTEPEETLFTWFARVSSREISACLF